MLDKKNFYINGQWVAPIQPNDYKVIDPSTEEECAVISLGGVEDVNNAVGAAKKAFETSEDSNLILLQARQASLCGYLQISHAVHILPSCSCLR